MNRLLPLTALALLAACAQGPDAIAPVSMAGAFADTPCAQAQHMLTVEQNNLTLLSNQQRQTATGDVIGVILLGVPTASLFGGDKAGLIAASKGKVAALQARVDGCR